MKTGPTELEKTMHTRLRFMLTTVLLALVAVPTPALAQDARGYIGLGLGMSTAKDACDGISGPGISCDDQDTAFKILGGYQVNPNFAVEVGYTNLGEASASFAGLGTVSVESSGFEVLAVGIAPVAPNWSLFGKLGFFIWDVDAKDGTGLVGNMSESGSDLTYGFGVSYDFSKSNALRLEYQVYTDIGDANTTGQDDVSVLGASLIFKF